MIIYHIIKNQKEIIDKKIVELNSIKNSIENLENSIEEALEIGINKPFIKFYEQRKLRKYNYTSRYTEEFEMQLRKSLIDIEKEYNSFNSKIAFETSYKDLIENNEVVHTKTMIELDEGVLGDDDTIAVSYTHLDVYKRQLLNV